MTSSAYLGHGDDSRRDDSRRCVQKIILINGLDSVELPFTGGTSKFDVLDAQLHQMIYTLSLISHA